MFGANSVQFTRKLRAAYSVYLICMYLKSHAERLCGAEYSPRLVRREHARFTEYVAKLREPTLVNVREHLIDYEFYVCFLIVFVFFRHRMCGHKRRHKLYRLRMTKLLHDVELLYFVVER